MGNSRGALARQTTLAGGWQSLAGELWAVGVRLAALEL